MDFENSNESLILPYPKVVLAKNTHVYNGDKEIGLKIGQMRNTTLDNFKLLADDLLKFLDREASKESDPNDPNSPMITIISKPMIATGESLLKEVDLLARAGYDHIIATAIIAAPQGVDLMQMLHPEVPLYIAFLEQGLNRKGEIIPGFGENGHRLFDGV